MSVGRRGARILAAGLAILASASWADDIAPWEPPPSAPPDQAVHDRLRSVPAAAIKSFKLITGPLQRGPLRCSSREDRAAAARGPAGIPELLARVQGGASPRERIGAAAALGDMGLEGRDALLDLLARAPDDGVLIACIAGLPPGDARSLAAAIRWYPLPTTSQDVIDVAWSDRAGCGRDPFVPEKATVACVATDLVAGDVDRSLRKLPRLLDSEDATTRRAAAWALRNAITAYAPHATRHAERALWRHSDDEDETVRVAAVAPSCRSKARRARRRIASHALDDESAIVRDAALVALSCEDAPRVPRSLLPELRRIGHDAQAPEATRSLASGLLLAREPTRDALEAFLDTCCGSCLGRTECDVGLAAMRTHLAILTPWIIEHGEAHDERRVMEQLVHLRVPLPVAACVQRLGSEDAAIRTAALQMLEMIGTSAAMALPLVRAGLHDPDQPVRDASARALLALAPDESWAIRAVRPRLSRGWAAGVTERTPRHALESLATDEDEHVRQSAWVALVRGAGSVDEARDAARRAGDDTPDNAAAARAALAELERARRRAERVHSW